MTKKKAEPVEQLNPFETVMLPIGKLKHAEYNPRVLTDEDRADILASLADFGTVQPAVVNMHKGRELVIVGGNQRVLIAEEDLKWTQFPCWLVNVPIEKERKLNVRLNRNQARWDYDKLIKEFDASELLELGFNEEDFADCDIAILGGDDVDKNFDSSIMKPGEGLGSIALLDYYIPLKGEEFAAMRDFATRLKADAGSDEAKAEFTVKIMETIDAFLSAQN